MGLCNILILGIILMGLGMIVLGFVFFVLMFNFIFGVMMGVGIGFGYVCFFLFVMKWFYLSKKGMVNGLIVVGFGLVVIYFVLLILVLIIYLGI